MGRMDGSKVTKEFYPVVRCISKPAYPMSLLTSIWWGSRHSQEYSPGIFNLLRFTDCRDELDLYRYQDPIRESIRSAYPEYASEGDKKISTIMDNLVKTVIDSDLPPLEAINFVFEVDNASVAWREQLVRCRDAGYWVQTSRTMDLSTIDANRSKSIQMLGGDEAVKIYDDTVETIREAYEKLQALGVPGEDIRLAPSCQIHRVYWFVNLRVLIRLIKKRADWIAQGSLWVPILGGIFSTLTEDGDEEYNTLMEMVRNVACKPAVVVKDGKVVEHHYDIENMDRYTGKDPQPCDPLWLAYHNYKMPKGTDIEFYKYLKSLYIKIWPKEYLDVIGWYSEDPDQLGDYDPE